MVANRASLARAGSLAAVNLVSLSLSFLARLLLARFLGPGGFGLFSIWYNNVQMFALLGMYGQQSNALRSLAESRATGSDTAQVAGAILRLTAISSILAGTSALAFYTMFQQGGGTTAALLLGMVVAAALSSVLSAIHRSLGHQIIGALFDRIVPQAIVVGGVVIAALAPNSFISAAWLFFIAFFTGLSTSLTYLAATNRDVAKHALRLGNTIRKRLLPAFPFFAASVGLALNLRIFLAIAGVYYSGRALGEIGLLFTLSSVILIPATTINLAVGPTMARAFASGGRKRSRFLALLYISAVTIAAGVFAAGLAIAYPEFPLSMGFGQWLQYRVIGLIIIAHFFAAIAVGLSFLQQMSGHATWTAGAVIAIATLKIISVTLFAKFSGIFTMALAEAALSFLMVLVLVICLLSTSPIFARRG